MPTPLALFTDELRETTVPASELTGVIDSDRPIFPDRGTTNLGRFRSLPRLCVAFLVVSPAFLTSEFPLRSHGSRPKGHVSDGVSTSGSSAMQVLATALSATQVAVFIDADVLHAICLDPPRLTV